MTMKKANTIFKVAGVSFCILLLCACNPIGKATESPSMLIVESVLGYTADGTPAAFLESDVVRGHTPGGGEEGTVFSDTATITITALLVDPASGTGSSPYNAITLTGYDVSYTLLTGGGTPGVDVPNHIMGSLSSLRVPIGESVSVPFVVVLSSAKEVAPLFELWEGGTRQAIARIDLRGEDQIGNPVQATGHLTIYFANYDDPPPPDEALIKR